MGDHLWLNRRDGEVALHADAGTYRTDDGCGGQRRRPCSGLGVEVGRRTASRIGKGSIATPVGTNFKSVGALASSWRRPLRRRGG